MVLWLLTVIACSPPSPTRPRAAFETEAVTQGRASFGVVPGSRVAVNDGVLAVDAPDGFRWMEVRWLDGFVQPQVTAWSVDQCDGLIWDRLATPIEGVQTRTGLCTRQGQEYWAFLALETRGDRTLMTTWLAHRESIAYEDAWVEYTHTALSVTGAGAPFLLLAEPELRRLVRDKATTSTGYSPVPGGGELGAAISEGLADAWTRRQAEPAPSWVDAN